MSPRFIAASGVRLVAATMFLFAAARALDTVRAAEWDRKGNFVVIFTDDQGYGDIGFHLCPHGRLAGALA